MSPTAVWIIAGLSAVGILALFDAQLAGWRRKSSKKAVLAAWSKKAEALGLKLDAAVEGKHDFGTVIPILRNGSSLIMRVQSTPQEDGLANRVGVFGPARRNESFVTLDGHVGIPPDIQMRGQKIDKTLAKALGDDADDASFMTTVDFNTAVQPLMTDEHAERRSEIAKLLSPRDLAVEDGMISWKHGGILKDDLYVSDVVDRVLRLAEIVDEVFGLGQSAG